MRVLLGAATLALWSLGLAGCAMSGSERNIAQDMVGSDNTVTAATGDTFTLRMTENASTGYMWERRDPLPDGIAELGNAYIQDQQTTPEPGGVDLMTGVGGTRAFTYRCDHAASGLLSFKLYAPGDRANPVEEKHAAVTCR
jgi:predicted secreted protein